MNANMGGVLLASATFVIGTLAAPAPAFAAAPPPKVPATITVQNDRPVPIDVYLQSGYFDTKIGSVAADGLTVLHIPRYLDGTDAQIFVRPQIGLELETPEVALPTHGTLDILVPDNDVGYVVQPNQDAIPNPGVNTTTLTVRNPRDDAVKVVIERGDFDTTIGTVPADHVRTFDLPASLTREPQDVKIFVVPTDGLELMSQYFMLRPRAHLEVKVPLG